MHLVLRHHFISFKLDVVQEEMQSKMRSKQTNRKCIIVVIIIIIVVPSPIAWKQWFDRHQTSDMNISNRLNE